MNRNGIWWACLVAALALSVVSFTPLVIPAGEFRPMLAGIPLTLWTGILIAFAFVALTYVAGKVHPGERDEEAER